MFKADRSHSEVGDTLRYFNSVSSSKSWCGEEYFQVGRFPPAKPLSGKTKIPSLLAQLQEGKAQKLYVVVGHKNFSSHRERFPAFQRQSTKKSFIYLFSVGEEELVFCMQFSYNFLTSLLYAREKPKAPTLDLPFS